jgi:hypothetical protein
MPSSGFQGGNGRWWAHGFSATSASIKRIFAGRSSQDWTRLAAGYPEAFAPLILLGRLNPPPAVARLPANARAR